MAMVLVLTFIVILAIGALAGALIAAFLPKPVAPILWALMLVAAIAAYINGIGGDDLARVEGQVLAFGVLAPLALGSLIGALLFWRREARRAE